MTGDERRARVLALWAEMTALVPVEPLEQFVPLALELDALYRSYAESVLRDGYAAGIAAEKRRANASPDSATDRRSVSDLPSIH